MRKHVALFFVLLLVPFLIMPPISSTMQSIEKRCVSHATENLFLRSSTINATAPHLESPENGTFIQSDYTITFRWTNVSDTANYTLQIDNSPFFNTTQLREIEGINDTKYALANGLPSGDWYWRVYAVFYNGDIVYSEIWCIHVVSRATPTIDPLQEFQRLSGLFLALILLLLMIILFPGGLLTKKLAIYKKEHKKTNL